MTFFDSIAKSFGDLKIAVGGILSDVWKRNRVQFCIVIFFSTAIGIVPYAVTGSQALLVNHLVSLVPLKHLDNRLWELVALMGGGYLVRLGVSSAYQYFRKLSWMDRRQQYDLQLSEKLTLLDVATHEDPTFQDEVKLLREQGSSFAMTNFLDSLIQNTQNIVGVVAAAIIVCAVDWRYFAIVFCASLPQLYCEIRYGKNVWYIHPVSDV